jgi:hypothetical protein
MRNILVVNYASRMGKKFGDENSAKLYADEKVDLWGHGQISIIGFVDERSMAQWVKDKLGEEWVIS